MCSYSPRIIRSTRGHESLHLTAAMLGALSMLLVGTPPVGADHGIPVGPPRMSPVVVGVLAGVLVLAIGLALVAIAMLLARKPPRAP